ncbi:MAG: tetratricopeptide repeat protein [Candidatus Dormibacteraeota bacterium]|nr:tetratricopeptide repeat protein [Candidatus Dormibacteraeota bacterium]
MRTGGDGLRWINGVAAALFATVAVAGCGGAPRTDAQVATDELNAGLAAQGAGHNDEAAGHYRTVLVHDPHNQYAYYNLGVIDQNASRPQQAEKEYRQALQIDPNMTGALFNLAIIVTPGTPDQAATLYQQVIRLQPKNAAAHLNLGYVYRDQGKLAQAQGEFDAAVALDPSMASRRPPSPTPSQ